jgi:hypothetical protein
MSESYYNTVRLVYLALGDPPNPPFLRGAFPPIYPLKKVVAVGGGILTEPLFSHLLDDLSYEQGTSVPCGI